MLSFSEDQYHLFKDADSPVNLQESSHLELIDPRPSAPPHYSC